MQFDQDTKRLVIPLEGRIDSNNAGEFEDRVTSLIDEYGARQVELDAAGLTYISSAGLRVFVKLLKRLDGVSLVNASPEVYDVFEMTGFTQMMEVRRALRKVSVDGLELIGAGANGRVYRLDEERIIKVYNPVTNTPEKILREREVSRKAFVRGIPSAISFELVRVGDSYGIIYEMVRARTLSQVFQSQPERLEEYATRMAGLLRTLHATEFEEGELPDARQVMHMWVGIAEQSGMYPSETIAKMRAAIDAIPHNNKFIHGDFHTANIMVTDDDELVLIDMGDASMGDPVIDLAFSAQIMFVMQRNPAALRQYTSLDPEQMGRVWNTFIRAYYGMDDDARIAEIERRLMFYAVIRTIPGITFSEAIPDEARPMLAKQVSDFFLREYDHFMGD